MTLEVQQLLKETIGLDPVSIGRPIIEQLIRARMAHCGVRKTTDYCRQLRSSEAEMRELIEAVVVPETSFFRDPCSFEALTQIVIGDWAPRHSNESLRVLSAPCSTGEEPYSIAMALLDAGFPSERIQIDAVDISAKALDLGRLGAYRHNSFRNKDAGFRERYFQRIDDRYQLTESVRSRVRFHYGNLVTEDFLAGNCYDIIFCRNVLIYFDPPTQQRVIKTLIRLLASMGILFVGASETSLLRDKGLTAVDHTHSFAYRRVGSGRKNTVPLIPKPPEAPTTTAISRLPVAKSKPEAPLIDLDAARELADAGRLTEAAATCEADLKIKGASAPAYYLLGLIRDATGDPQGAAELYRKALYLEPDHVEALTHLALLSERSGDVAGAKLLQTRAERAIKRKASDPSVDDKTEVSEQLQLQPT